mgnify:CR=1 FL=1
MSELQIAAKNHVSLLLPNATVLVLTPQDDGMSIIVVTQGGCSVTGEISYEGAVQEDGKLSTPAYHVVTELILTIIEQLAARKPQ